MSYHPCLLQFGSISKKLAPFLLASILLLAILPGVAIGADYEVLLECPDNSKTSDGSNSVYYTITVYNKGIESDTYTLEPKLVTVTGGDPDPEKWSYDVYPLSLTLEPGGSGNVGLTVGSGCGCQVGTTAQVDVHATSAANPLVNDVISTFTIRGNDAADDPPPDINNTHPRPDFRVHLQEDYIVKDPPLGERLNFTLAFTNLYNGSHPLDLIIMKVPQDWTVDLEEAHITLEVNGSATATFYVTPPVSAIADVHSVMIRAVSSLDGTVRRNVYVSISISMRT